MDFPLHVVIVQNGVAALPEFIWHDGFHLIVNVLVLRLQCPGFSHPPFLVQLRR